MEFGPSCPKLTLPLKEGELHPPVPSKPRASSHRNLLCWLLYFRTKGESERHHSRLTNSTQRSETSIGLKGVTYQPEVGLPNPKSIGGLKPH